MPLGRNAPNDWPAEPVRVTSIDPGGRPCSPRRTVTSWPSIVPTARSVFLIGSSISTRAAVLEHDAAATDQLVVEVLVELVVLLAQVAPRLGLREVGSDEHGREVEALRLPVRDGAVDVEQVAAADDLVERAVAELGEVLAHLLRDELEEVHDELGLAR